MKNEVILYRPNGLDEHVELPLHEKVVCAKIAQVQKEGSRMVKKDILNYILDAFLSTGYRLNSKQGTQFRIWAKSVEGILNKVKELI